MNKIILIGALMLVVLVGLVMSGCDRNGLPQLHPAIEAQMRQDWQTQFGYPLGIYDYYGTFNGAVVIFSEGDIFVVTEITIAGTVFLYNMDFNISVWKRGVFLSLYDAYQENILTQENIIKIGETHNKIHQNILNILTQENIIKIGETHNKNTTK